MSLYRCSAALALLFIPGSPLLAADPPAGNALAKMPVKEVTIFKDGHAFLLHEGNLATDAAGNVNLDYLPSPVIGTFWPYAAEKNATLHQVTAARRVVKIERTALTLRDLVEANPGADVIVTETSNHNYPANIIGFLVRSSEELAATSPADSGEPLPQKSNLLLLKTADGTKVVPFERIQDVKFLGKYKTTLPLEEHRNLLTMRLTWADGKPAKSANVGMAYLQKGIRWIPEYHVSLDGKGKAVVRLQATLLNELTDLENVTLNLVVGVPTFQFKETLDPISLSNSLSKSAAQLSQYFENDSRTAYALSNAMMTQTARMSEVQVRNVPAQEADLGPDIGGQGKNEDLFIYTVKNVTLAKGQRMVLPVTQQTLEYKDVYTLDLPFAPPPEIRHSGNSKQAEELARLMAAPKVTHKVRLLNKSGQPLTTAPALIVKDQRVLAQNMMTYTAIGASTDLTVTTAVDVKVKKTDKEARRTPNAATWDGHSYQRVDLTGTVRLSNFRNQAVEVEVVRHVLGNVDGADNEGKAEMVNLFEDDGYAPVNPYPYWWGYYSWPGWWGHFNGIGRISWQVKLDPGKSVDLGYNWHYYWR